MALPAPIQALYDKLKSFYNGNAYNAQSNPGGFARGGNQVGVFIAMLRDFADFGKAVAEAGVDAPAAATAAANSAGAAATSAQSASDSADRAAQFDPATYAPKNSPALTGNPTAPTPAAGDNDTSIATTAFVQTAAQSAADAVSAGPFTFAYAFR